MTLSLTDRENANTEDTTAAEVANDGGGEACLGAAEERAETRKAMTAEESLEDDADSAGNSTDDQLAADGATMSTDDSDHDLSTPLPQTTPADENGNSKH